MKNKLNYLIFFLLVSTLVFYRSCEEGIDPGLSGKQSELESKDGVSEEDIDTYAGDLGILISCRDLVKKGYLPEIVSLSTDALEGDYNQDLEVDPFTNQAQLSFAVEDLSDEQEYELRNGVGLELEIKDGYGNTITSASFSVLSFEENGKLIHIDASDLELVEQTYDFHENLTYYLQTVDANGGFGSNVVWKPSNATDTKVKLTIRESDFWPGTTSEQFYFHKFPGTDNTFAIYSANTNRYLMIYEVDGIFWQSGEWSYPMGLDDDSLLDRYRFVIKQEANGLYTLNDLEGRPLRNHYSLTGSYWSTGGNGNVQYFRIISLDIDWEVQELDTKHQKPIFPAANTSFGFNSTLSNCGSGSLEQQVGVERTVETTYTTHFSESIGLSGSVSTSFETTVSATAEASFFGTGASVSGEVSTGVELTVEASKTSTVGEEKSVSETHTFFSSRVVTVPAGHASMVYDAYQTYSNVRVPYVKRLRLSGKKKGSNESLSGAVIATQLYMTDFSGVITKLGSDYVEISLAGNIYLDNIVDTQTEVLDIPTNCK